MGETVTPRGTGAKVLYSMAPTYDNIMHVTRCFNLVQRAEAEQVCSIVPNAVCHRFEGPDMGQPPVWLQKEGGKKKGRGEVSIFAVYSTEPRSSRMARRVLRQAGAAVGNVALGRDLSWQGQPWISVGRSCGSYWGSLRSLRDAGSI